jgi:hypothetical protein
MPASFLQLTAESTDGEFAMPFLLLPPPDTASANTVCCPITHEPIGSETYAPPTSSSLPALLLTQPAYAHLLCMELIDCKHRFDARALVAHFLHNGMTCPMCRQGNPKALFDARATFRHYDLSPWVLHQHDVLRTQKRRRIMVSNMLAAILLFDTLETNLLQQDATHPHATPPQVEFSFTLLPSQDSSETVDEHSTTTHPVHLLVFD